MSECPQCERDEPVVEGLCWGCGYRRGWPVVLWEGEPPQDMLYTWTDEDYASSVEAPPS